ncbi:hypothetical protein BDZ89DRAFT_1054070 [Hymenopellis radicata]|nr:hypothetical protein BDZ89DRAFT_1054070 [Hymenopellis radicata]
MAEDGKWCSRVPSVGVWTGKVTSTVGRFAQCYGETDGSRHTRQRAHIWNEGSECNFKLINLLIQSHQGTDSHLNTISKDQEQSQARNSIPPERIRIARPECAMWAPPTDRATRMTDEKSKRDKRISHGRRTAASSLRLKFFGYHQLLIHITNTDHQQYRGQPIGTIFCLGCIKTYWGKPDGEDKTTREESYRAVVKYSAHERKADCREQGQPVIRRELPEGLMVGSVHVGTWARADNVGMESTMRKAGYKRETKIDKHDQCTAKNSATTPAQAKAGRVGDREVKGHQASGIINQARRRLQ